MGRISYEESTSLKVYLALRNGSHYFLFCFLGGLIWTMTYFLLFSYKEVLMYYLRSNEKFDGRGYYYKFIEYKPHIKNLYIFNIAILIFWIAIYLINDEEWRHYCLYSGFIIFILGYIISWSVYYKFYSYKNDYLDDIKFFIKYFKEKFFNKSQKEKEKNN